jgi:hypothetical protein
MKRKFPIPYRDSNPRSSSPSPALCHRAIPSHDDDDDDKIFENNIREAFSRSSTKKKKAVLGTSHITRKLKPEWWSAPLVQEEWYQGKGNL